MYNYHFQIKKALISFLLFSFASSSFASVVISGTRVIYPEKEKEVTVKLTNQGNSPVLIQSWIDNGDINSKPDNINVPFVLTPPINRLDPDKSQTMRLNYTGTKLPKDQESVFWLNVLEIPSSAKSSDISNRLQVAFRSRIKVFFRPSSLPGNATDAANGLRWSWSGHGKQVIVQNDSPYFVSLVSVTVNKDSTAGEMVSPFGSQAFTLKNEVSAGMSLSYDYVNDWGAVKTKSLIL